MNPEQALELQIKRYRAMTGEQRLRIALDLHALSCAVARQGIQFQHPGASEVEIDEMLRARIAAQYQ